MANICITGGGGFIGSHLAGYLKDRGHWVRCVDIKRPEWGWPWGEPDEFQVLDLRRYDSALLACMGMDQVYALATLMGDGTTLRYIQPDAVKAVFDERQTAVEWKCDYCGAVMLREDTECRGCGATRPFLYDR